MKLPRNLPGNEYDPKKHCRRSIRLRHYDYSRAGAYFITVCTDGRELLFGEVIDDEVKLNELGRIAAEEWLKSAQVRTEIELDTWIVMPNHIHGIAMITDDRRKSDRPVAPTRNTFNKTRRVNLRVTERDFSLAYARAREEGIPYQTLLSSVIHKYLSGRLVEKR